MKNKTLFHIFNLLAAVAHFCIAEAMKIPHQKQRNIETADSLNKLDTSKKHKLLPDVDSEANKDESPTKYIKLFKSTDSHLDKVFFGEESTGESTQNHNHYDLNAFLNKVQKESEVNIPVPHYLHCDEVLEFSECRYRENVQQAKPQTSLEQFQLDLKADKNEFTSKHPLNTLDVNILENKMHFERWKYTSISVWGALSKLSPEQLHHVINLSVLPFPSEKLIVSNLENKQPKQGEEAATADSEKEPIDLTNVSFQVLQDKYRMSLYQGYCVYLHGIVHSIINILEEISDTMERPAPDTASSSSTSYQNDFSSYFFVSHENFLKTSTFQITRNHEELKRGMKALKKSSDFYDLYRSKMGKLGYFSLKAIGPESILSKENTFNRMNRDKRMIYVKDMTVAVDYVLQGIDYDLKYWMNLTFNISNLTSRVRNLANSMLICIRQTRSFLLDRSISSPKEKVKNMKIVTDALKIIFEFIDVDSENK